MGSTAEKQFIRFAGRRFQKLRHGWPDFFVLDRKKNVFLGVEVKQGMHTLSPAQRAMFAALETFGLKVVIWNPDNPRSFVPWKTYKPNKPPRRPRLKRDKQEALYVRVTPEIRTSIEEIAARRGYPHTVASVASDMIAKGLLVEAAQSEKTKAA